MDETKYVKHEFKSGDKLYATQLNEMDAQIALNETNINLKADKIDVPTKTSQLTNDSGFLTEHQSLDGYAKTDDIPTNTSELTNNSGFITKTVDDLTNYYQKSETYTQTEIDEKISLIPKFSISVVSALPTSDINTTIVYLVKDGVEGNLYTEYIYVEGKWEILGSQRVDLTGYATEAWVNGRLGDYLKSDDIASWAKVASKPSYTAAEVGALPEGTKIPAKTSDLQNDSGFITGYTESDPTVPAWAKQPDKPLYSKSEVGLGNVDNVKQYSASNPPPYPVTSVNGKTGAVTLGAGDVGARPNTWTPSASDVGAATTAQFDQLSEAIADQQTEIDGKQPKGDYALKSELTAETTAREQAVADLNARLGQQTVLIAEGETQEEAEAWLETDADKTKVYLMPDDTFWQYKKTMEITEGGVAYTNLLPNATDTDGVTIYGGDYNGDGVNDGYQTETRLSGSSGNTGASGAPMCVSGFIPAQNGDVIRIKNAYAAPGSTAYVISYNAAKARINNQVISQASDLTWSDTTSWATVDKTDGNLLTFTLSSDNFGTDIEFIRFNADMTSGNTIITVNQEIKEGGGTTTTIVEKWASTGHGLVTTNYDAVIADLTSIVTAHTAEIVALEDLTEQHSKDIELLKEAVENGASGGTSGGSSGNTNLLPTAIDTDGSIYNGIGYKPSTRLSGSSGLPASSQEEMCASGFIAASNGNIIKIKGATPVSGVSQYLITYNSSKSIIKYQSFSIGSSDWSTVNQNWYSYADGVLTITLTEENFGADIAFFRFNAHMDENTVVTVTSPTSSGGGNNTTILTPEEALALIRNWDKPVYERLTPFLLDTDLTITNYPKTYADAQDPDGALRRQNVQAVYDEYNALCTAHPDFVRDITDKEHGLDGATETTFGGVCSDGIQYVRVYEFCEREGRHSNTTNADYWSETKPTFIIVTGIHWEYNGVYSMLNALKIITENPEFRDMRRNCRFIVIPMSNPYCFTTYNNSGGGHYNANGVEIHNNFAVDFNNTIDSTHGTAPFSEIETRYIDNAMRKYADTGVCLLTCHSNASKGSNFIWGSVATKFMCNVSLRLVDLMSYAWDAKYDNYRDAIDTQKSTGSNPQEDGDYRCGFASLSTSTGTETKQALWYGMQGINVEVYERFYLFDPEGTDVSLAASRGAEVYANLLRLLAVTYDHNDRDKYAPNPPYKLES